MDLALKSEQVSCRAWRSLVMKRHQRWRKSLLWLSREFANNEYPQSAKCRNRTGSRGLWAGHLSVLSDRVTTEFSSAKGCAGNLSQLGKNVARNCSGRATVDRLEDGGTDLRLSRFGQQAVRFLARIGELRVTESCQRRTIQDGFQELAILFLEGYDVRHRSVTEPGGTALRLVADTAKLGQCHRHARISGSRQGDEAI